MLENVNRIQNCLLGPKVSTVDKKTGFSSNKRTDFECIFKRCVSKILWQFGAIFENVVLASMSSLLLICALDHVDLPFRQ